ncbi:MAG: hypothetical protein LBK07_03435 [Tannerella sp.]|nr:hypothetical protein [Tannerella sp.]
MKNRMILLCMMACLAGALNAQSFYDAKTGRRLAGKTGVNTYEVTGNTYVIKNNQLITTLNGELREDLIIARFLRKDDRVIYYNPQEEMVGYYVPTEGRYYDQLEMKNESKDNQRALLYNGLIYTTGGDPAYRVDEGLEPEFIGFILFFFFC